ncbi:hypothetical protein LRS10_20390 [Phenylobacterium sp. J426]|uniref:hypothetical protein n=1 Tax=Phenylobacterium sp. J426 TaxID=2898439 RepID=UPI0021511F6B|nr:hypothetical protein [Phenylobacterium sp. J426]MCR5876298.1 hypothetical protein [Phenylobacterium sp. J426]
MERVAFRAQTVVADVALAALAFALAFVIARNQAGLDLASLSDAGFVQLTALYGGIAGIFALLFRRELSPWRYVSIPDALVLARSALLTVGVFLLGVFVLTRAQGVPRSALFMAPLFQMVFSMGVRITRRALHERALESFSPLKTVTDRLAQAPTLLLIGPPPWPTPICATWPVATTAPIRRSVSSPPRSGTWASRCAASAFSTRWIA